MADMVASALVQEGVSGVVSLAMSNREERASHGHLMERLEMAQSHLEFALERSSKVPITQVSLLRRRMTLKCAFRECTALLRKHKHKRNLPGDEEVEQTTVSSSFCRKIMHAVLPAVWYFSSPKIDNLLTRSDVQRFEWFAEEAHKFVRDMGSAGCSLLARYSFSNPIVTQLLQGKSLQYESWQGRKSFFLTIGAGHTEDHGVMAQLFFQYTNPQEQMDAYSLTLFLRLSESTDIVEITTKCLRSLGPNFNCLPQVAAGQLAHLSAQVTCGESSRLDLSGTSKSDHNSRKKKSKSDHSVKPACDHLASMMDRLASMMDHLASKLVHLATKINQISCEVSVLFRQDPLCCTTGGLDKHCSSSTFSSELSGRFPEQVSYFKFSCNVSAVDYNLRSSTKQVKGKNVKSRPYVKLEATFLPHYKRSAGRGVRSIHHVEETIRTDAINYFNSQPKQTKYEVSLFSAHGGAHFTVSKPTVDMRCTPRTIGDGSTTQRVSKRKR